MGSIGPHQPDVHQGGRPDSAIAPEGGLRIGTRCGDCCCCEQALSFWGVLEELDLGKRVPDLKGLGFTMLSANDSLTFASNSWNMTLDPQSGRA